MYINAVIIEYILHVLNDFIFKSWNYVKIMIRKKKKKKKKKKKR